ncbi:hypothetical protein CEE69_21945 [Rhodopirellula bahusiensis]|uniref:VWFA domain-containing protein n=2 Tax=Rhodopirellula bahusiensis TaxID=2014065 RepID=A0A2G1W276_9BACT|nr:hypothetical protein CEE69_21945 [Rhodopirellula bahusiensis]
MNGRMNNDPNPPDRAPKRTHEFIRFDAETGPPGYPAACLTDKGLDLVEQVRSAGELIDVAAEHVKYVPTGVESAIDRVSSRRAWPINQAVAGTVGSLIPLVDDAIKQARTARDEAQDRLDGIDRQILVSKFNAAFAKSTDGKFVLGCIISLLLLMGVGSFSEVTTAVEVVRASDLYQDVDPTTGAIIEPGVVQAFCFSFASIFGTLISIEFIALMSQRDKSHWLYIAIAVSGFSLAITASILFCMQTEGDQTVRQIAGRTIHSSTPPWYVSAIQMGTLSLINAMAFHWLRRLTGKFFRPASVENAIAAGLSEYIAKLNDSIRVSSQTLIGLKEILIGRLAVVEEHADAIRSAVKNRKNRRKAEQLRRQADRLAPLVLLAALTFGATSVGCGRTTPTLGVDGSTGVPSTASGNVYDEPIELFIFDSLEGRPVQFGERLELLVLEELASGSEVKVVTPGQGSGPRLVVPPGTFDARVRNANFIRQYPAMESYWADPPTGPETHIGICEIAKTIEDLRETELPCRVLLFAPPLMTDPNHATYSMADGLVPSKGCIDEPTTPFTTVNQYPDGTMIAFLSLNSGWARSSWHADASRDFVSHYFGRQGANSILFTRDLKRALAFDRIVPPIDLTDQVDKPALIDPRMPSDRIDPPMPRTPVEVPVVTSASIRPAPERRLSAVDRNGSIEERLVAAGGSRAESRLKSVEVFVLYDRSASMEKNIDRGNVVIDRLIVELVPLTSSTKIGLRTFSQVGFETMPLCDVGNTANANNLRSFLADIETEPGDGKWMFHLPVALEALSAEDAQTHQILMVVGDHATIDQNLLQQAFQTKAQSMSGLVNPIRQWATKPGTNRSVVMQFCGHDPDERACFAAIADAVPNGLLASDPDSLIDAIIASIAK